MGLFGTLFYVSAVVEFQVVAIGTAWILIKSDARYHEMKKALADARASMGIAELRTSLKLDQWVPGYL